MLNVENIYNTPVRQITARVELYQGSTLKNTFRHTDKLISIEIQRVGEQTKFFGFSICQRLNFHLIDTNRELNITTANTIKVFIGNATFPTFYVSEVHRDENTNELSITAYDILKQATKHTTSELTLTKPYTTAQFINACASLLGITASLYSDAFFNTSYADGINIDGTETIRDILNQACEATLSICYINNQNKLVFKRLKADNAVALAITKDDFFTLSSNDNRRLVEIASVTELGDNVSAKTTQTGTTQYVRDNAFWELRDDIGTILNRAIGIVGNLTINKFECEWRGNPALEIGDRITLQTKDNNTVSAFVLDDVITYDGGLEQKTQWDYEENDETESNSSNLGDALKQTFARVDKVNKEINLVVSDVQKNTDTINEVNEDLEKVTGRVSTTENKVSSLELDTESIKGSVSDLQTTTTTITTTVNNLQNSVDNIEVGGRNLARNTATPIIAKPTGTNTYGSPSGIFHISDFGKTLLLDTDNTEFTVQFDWESAGFDTAVTAQLSFRKSSSGSYGTVGAKFDVPIGDSSGSVKHTFTPTDDQRTYGLGWLVSGFGTNNRDASITISNFKLEIGNKATTWTVAPEDIENDISQLKSDLQTTTSTVTNTVARVGTLETTTESIIGRVSNVETTTTQNTGAIGTLQTYVDQLEVGGRNLLLDTNAPSLTKVSAEYNRYFANTSTSTIVPTFVEITDAPINIQYGTNSVVTATGTSNRMLAWYSGGKVKLVQGDTYTMSCYARVTDGEKMALRFQYGASPYCQVDNIEVNSSEWKRYSATFVYDGASYGDPNGNGCVIYMGAVGTYLGTLQCCGFKLEKGTEVTDWIPAPEDVDYKIYQAQNTADLATETITEVTERVSTLETNADGITATVSSHTTTITNLQEASSSQASNITELQNAMNNLGTRNYIINTMVPDVSTQANRPKLVGQTSNTACQTGLQIEVAEHGFRTTCGTAKRPFIRFGTSTASAGTLNGLEVGETYTLSFDTTYKLYSGTIENQNDYYYRVYLYTDTTTTGTFASTAYKTIKTITPARRGVELKSRCEFTFTVPENATMLYIYISGNGSTDTYYDIGDFIEIRNVQLEKGKIATDYTPAPEDYQKAITSAEQALSNDIATTQASIGDLTGNINDLTNDLDGVKDNINNTTDKLTTSINELKKEVNLRMTDEDFEVAISEKLSNGVKSVETETGYKFDKDGLTIAKSDSDISTFIDNTGMTVKNSFEDVLTATAGGVDAVNLTARNFLIVGTRFLITDYGDDQVGIFYIGS